MRPNNFCGRRLDHRNSPVPPPPTHVYLRARTLLVLTSAAFPLLVSSLDAIIEEDSSFEPSFLLSPKGESQPGNTGYPGDSNGSHALNGSIEDGIEF